MREDIIAYYRVSTESQKYGIDAQRKIVSDYAKANNLNIIEEVEEIESGCEDERPKLKYALAKCRKHKATLVAAYVDRISRDICYAAWVFFKSGVDVRALDLPDSKDPMVFAVYFGYAQQEAEMISKNTKQALAALKAKGVKLGRPNAEITPEMRALSAAARREQANNNPANLAAAAELRRYFATKEKRNLSAAARHLNDMCLFTSRGVWHDAKSVKLLIQRYDI